MIYHVTDIVVSFVMKLFTDMLESCFYQNATQFTCINLSSELGRDLYLALQVWVMAMTRLLRDNIMNVTS